MDAGAQGYLCFWWPALRLDVFRGEPARIEGEQVGIIYPDNSCSSWNYHGKPTHRVSRPSIEDAEHGSISYGELMGIQGTASGGRCRIELGWRARVPTRPQWWSISDL
jgi:hypothetical protein